MKPRPHGKIAYNLALSDAALHTKRVKTQTSDGTFEALVRSISSPQAFPYGQKWNNCKWDLCFFFSPRITLYVDEKNVHLTEMTKFSLL